MLPRVPCGLAGVGAESEAARRRAPDEPAQRPLAAALKTHRKFSPATIMALVRLRLMLDTAVSVDA